MARTYRVGISGAGIIGTLHAQAIQELYNAEVVAVAEPRKEAADSFVTEYGGSAFSSLEDMLRDTDLDIVHVATPSGMHPEQVIKIAGAGKHVVTEKPMAITAEGATTMIEACQRAGVSLSVIFQNRTSRDVMKVKRAIEKGLLGQPILANGSVHWHRTDEYYSANGGWRGTWKLDGGGALMNQGIHTVDLLQWYMDGIQDIQGFTGTLTHDIETEDTAAVAFRYGNGAMGTITATTSATEDAPVRIEIIGTKGRATIERNTLTRWYAEEELTDDVLSDDDRFLTDGWEPDEPFHKGHVRQLGMIFRCLDQGDQPPVAGPDARKAVDIILGIYESSRTGKRVERDAR